MRFVPRFVSIPSKVPFLSGVEQKNWNTEHKEHDCREIKVEQIPLLREWRIPGFFLISQAVFSSPTVFVLLPKHVSIYSGKNWMATSLAPLKRHSSLRHDLSSTSPEPSASILQAFFGCTKFSLGRRIKGVWGLYQFIDFSMPLFLTLSLPHCGHSKIVKF